MYYLRNSPNYQMLLTKMKLDLILAHPKTNCQMKNCSKLCTIKHWLWNKDRHLWNYKNNS